MDSTPKIIVVEDDFLIADFIQTALVSFGYNVIDICNSFDSFVKSVEAVLPDIVLVDIKIEGGKSGIDVAKYIRTNKDIPFVFISSLSDKKTIDAAKQTMPSAYLIKPFGEEDLYAAIEVALMNFAQRKNHNIPALDGNIILEHAIFIKQKQAFLKINKSDILYLEAKDNYVKIHTSKDAFLIRVTLNEIHQVLPVYFYRIHRSFMVNLNHIEQIHNEEIVLANKIIVPLSRNIYADLIERLQIIKQ